jgi:ABC-type multidrug transport system ATPase subunit
VRPAIEVRAIGQQAGSGFVTLRDVSLTVGHGELVAIVGGTETGRTALLDAMSGFRPPSAGSVRRRAGGVGYVPRDDTIHPALPLARALRYTALLRGAVHPDAAVADALCAVDLDSAGRPAVPASDLPGGDPPGGERKRAAIAAELLAGPRLFFLDDPTSGLDLARGQELMRVLRGLCDAGITVALTTRSPLDADRCDKVAVLAAGGDLAFFGTPAAARDYFGADSLDEIFERLAGLGDPAAAWSRRFFHFPRTVGGVSPVPTVPPQPGPARLVPDSAGPHSAGPVTTDPPGENLHPDLSSDLDPGLSSDLDPGLTSDLAPADPGGRALRQLRQWALLTRRNAEAAARSGRALAVLAGPPVAVALTFGVLSGRGGTMMASFWAPAGGFFVGLCYGLPQVRAEIGVLRRERFAGLSAGAYTLAKAAAALPLLGVADAVLAVVLGAVARPPPGGGYGPTFLTMLLSSAAAFGLGLLISAASAVRAPAPAAVTVFLVPQLLVAAAVSTLFGRPAGGDWLALAVFAVAGCAAATALVARAAPCVDRGSRTSLPRLRTSLPRLRTSLPRIGTSLPRLRTSRVGRRAAPAAPPGRQARRGDSPVRSGQRSR